MSMLRKGLVVAVAVCLVSSLSFAKDDKGAKKADGANRHGADGAARFAAMDGDGNGTVSLKEFTAAHEKRMAMRKEKMGDKWDAARAAKMPSAEDMFKKLDANADGELTAEEMNAGHKRHAEGEKKAVVKKEGVKKEAVKKEAVKKAAVKKAAVKKEAVKKQGKPAAAGKECPKKAKAAAEKDDQDEEDGDN